jgi:hypothetical protein
MGVAAALLTLGFFGFQILQERGRDTNRANTLADIAEQINQYRVENLQFPPETSVDFRTDGFYINGQNRLDFDGYRVSGEDSSTESTKYYYALQSGNFILCAQLESGKIESAGTAACPEVLP